MLLNKKFTINKEHRAVEEKVYIFEETMDIKIIEQVESLLGQKDYLYMNSRVLEKLKKLYDEFKLGDSNVAELENQKIEVKTMVVELTSDLLSDQEWQKEAIALFRKTSQNLIFITERRFVVNHKKEYTAFKVLNPNVEETKVKVDYEAYFSELWKAEFGELPDFDVKEFLNKIKFHVKVTTENVQNLVKRLIRETDDEQAIPGKKEIVSLLQMDKSSWREKLNSFVGMEQEKQKVKNLIRFQIVGSNMEEREFWRPMRTAIVGNSGTGKSSLIEVIGEAFVEEGILKKGMRRLSARDLVADHIGGSEEKLRKIVEESDLLIIDEMGGLNIEDKFSSSIIQQLVFLMEEKKDLHIIFAGYERDLKDLEKQNQGIYSRITDVIRIKDYDAETMIKIGISMLKKVGYDFDAEEIAAVLKEYVSKLFELENHGNARAMRNLIERILCEMLAKNPDDESVFLTKLSGRDVEEVIAGIRLQKDSRKDTRKIGFMYEQED